MGEDLETVSKNERPPNKFTTSIEDKPELLWRYLILAYNILGI